MIGGLQVSQSLPFNCMSLFPMCLSCPGELIIIGDSRIDHGRIGTPFVKKNIWSGDDNFSF